MDTKKGAEKSKYGARITAGLSDNKKLIAESSGKTIKSSTAKPTTSNRISARRKTSGGGTAQQKSSPAAKRMSGTSGTVSRKSTAGRSASKKNVIGTNRRKSVRKNTGVIRIVPLGGIEEIAKNMTIIEADGEMIIVDCGMGFPDNELFGVDIVIPDFSYVMENRDKVKGLVITHGHEDHIGAVPYLLKNLNLPVYGSQLSIGLIEAKLAEHGMSSKNLNVFKASDRLKLGMFEIEPINVNHSIPDAMALAIRTPYGTIVHSGDFKVDFTPILDDVINLRRFSELGDEGVLLFMCDSTNAEKVGHSVSERAVGESFEKLFSRAQNKRVIIASFASNIQRIQQILDLAEAKNRKVAICGRSMENYTNMASKLGYLKIPEGIIIGINEVDRYRDKDVVIITTGSQGEPMAALSRMANGSHRQISITKDDFVIISATPIPGNEKMINKVINELMKLGSEVIYETMYDVHASGHACRDEIKLMLNLIKPKYFVPIHGEYKHLKKNIEIAESSGIDPGNIVMPVIGGVIEVNENSINKAETVISGRILVDGLGVGDVGSSVLKERKHLSQYGLMVVVCTYDKTLGEFVSEPDIISRGFVYAKESDELFEEAKSVVVDLLEEYERSKRKKSRNTFKNEITDELSKLMYKKTRRSPMILPIIMEV